MKMGVDAPAAQPERAFSTGGTLARLCMDAAATGCGGIQTGFRREGGLTDKGMNTAVRRHRRQWRIQTDCGTALSQGKPLETMGRKATELRSPKEDTILLGLCPPGCTSKLPETAGRKATGLRLPACGNRQGLCSPGCASKLSETTGRKANWGLKCHFPHQCGGRKTGHRFLPLIGTARFARPSVKMMPCQPGRRILCIRQ